MLLATLRPLTRSLVAVAAKSDTRLNLLCPVALLTVLFVAVPLAHSSPGDPVWIAGIYDGADLDESVDALNSVIGLVEGLLPGPRDPVCPILRVIPSGDAAFPAPAVLSPLSGRAPPTV